MKNLNQFAAVAWITRVKKYLKKDYYNTKQIQTKCLTNKKLFLKKIFLTYVFSPLLRSKSCMIYLQLMYSHRTKNGL